MAVQNFLRIAVVAIGLSTLSFAAGVAGDLSNLDRARSGQRVVLRIPPEISSDAPRARPLLSTASASAATVHRPRRRMTEAPVEVSRLVESVQAAHEEDFGSAAISFEIAALEPAKPTVETPIKPSTVAAELARETKVA